LANSIADIVKQQKKILAKIKQLEKRVRNLEEQLTPMEATAETPVKRPLGIAELLELPDNLRKTVLAISELGEATAEEVAAKTGRTRNIVSVYLNQLVRSKHLIKSRKGRKIYFKANFSRRLLILLREII
jgi:sugar-specific transcriptional regulator TrmB